MELLIGTTAALHHAPAVSHLNSDQEISSAIRPHPSQKEQWCPRKAEGPATGQLLLPPIGIEASLRLPTEAIHRVAEEVTRLVVAIRPEVVLAREALLRHKDILAEVGFRWTCEEDMMVVVEEGLVREPPLVRPAQAWLLEP